VSAPVSSSLRALGSTALAATTSPEGLPVARALLVRALRALDLACSRFRPDSELTALNVAAGAPVAASLLLRDTVRAAVRVAEQSGGLVDPTIGRALRLAGYDRTLVRVHLREGSLVRPVFERAGRWREIELDDEAGTLRIPAGVELDLGATAKAFAADTIAQAAAAATGCGVLISIGGDIALAGAPPTGGWVIGIDDDHATPPERVAARVSLSTGGLASSGTRVRRWRTAVGELHHILDPRTGAPAAGPWTTVSVAAASCLDANAASTAAVVLGEAAPEWLSDRRLPARLAQADGRVLTVAGWPEERAA
jgi:thiamine biosynthesis lipoprotein